MRALVHKVLSISMHETYAKLPDILQTILLPIAENTCRSSSKYIQPDNDEIASSAREGLDLARVFSRIRDPIMREIVIAFVTKIATQSDI